MNHARVMTTPILVALIFAGAFIARAEGLWLSAWGRGRKNLQTARKRLPDLVGYVWRDGTQFSLFDDGTLLPVLGGGADLATLTLPQLREAHDEKSKRLAAAFGQAKTDDPDVLDLEKVTEYDGTNDEKHAAMLAEMKEINELGEHIQKKQELAAAAKGAEAARKQHDGQGIAHPSGETAQKEHKTLGQLFVESKAYLERDANGSKSYGPLTEIDLEKEFGKGVSMKTVFSVGSSYAVESIRLPSPITPFDRPRRVADLMPEGRTSQASIKYMEETTTTNNAAETAESGTKPEAALAFTERTDPVQKIAVTLPVTDEALEDIPFIESYINTRLRTFVELREDSQLINGDGTSPNISGILDRSIQTQALGADPRPDAIYKAMTKVRVVFMEPDGLVIHPNDWQQIALLRTSDDNYFWGGPVNSAPERIWGMPVVITTAIAEGTGLVGAWGVGAQVFRRTDITLQVGFVNDQFVKNQRTILAEERLALAVFRPTAFCSVTGI